MYMLIFVEHVEFKIRWRFFDTLEKAQVKMLEYMREDLGVNDLSQASPYDFIVQGRGGWTRLDYDNECIYQIIEIGEGR